MPRREEMKPRAMLQPIRLWCLLLLLALTACAPAREVRKRYFWPPSFEAPKIEYINFYQTDQDLRRGEDHWLEEAVFGQVQAQLMFVRPSVIAADVREGVRRVFVADQGASQVQVWDLQQQKIRWLKTELGEDFTFMLPAGIAVDAQGRIYVCDSLKGEIDVFGPDEMRAAKLKDAHLKRPTGIAVDDDRGLLYVVDTQEHQVDVLDLDGHWQRGIGKRGTGPLEFNFPLDVDLDAEGNLYILDAMNARVQVASPDGRFLRQFGERGTELGSFQIPKSIAVSPSGLVYVTDSLAHRFVVFDLDGNFLASIGGEYPMEDNKVAPGGFYLPEGIAVGRDESIWVVDSLNRMFHQFQYLTPAYLEAHPIRPEEFYLPPELLNKAKP